MVYLFSLNIETSIYINGGITHAFKINIGVRQGCTLFPYLLFRVGEIMNIMIKQITSKGEIKGVVMPIRQRM
jgi:hypothetical protein